MKTVTVVVSLQEWDTMLAALRLWQRSLEVDDDCGGVVIDTETYRAITELAHEHSDVLMQPKEIDALCERINCSEPPEDPVVVIEGGCVQDVFLPISNGKLPCTSIAYSLIDYDNLSDGVNDAFILDKWNSFSPALRGYFLEHCKDEYEKYFKEALDLACTCNAQSWYGKEHASNCPVTGPQDLPPALRTKRRK